MYETVEIYERTIDWAARLRRELPRIEAAIGWHAGKGTLDILDLGCGTGQHIEALAPRHPLHRFHGVDIDPAMIEAASARLAGLPNVVLARGDIIEQPPYPGKHFDVIYSVGNTMALVWGCGNLDAVLGALANMLHPGGSLLFHVLNTGNPRKGYVVSPVATLGNGKEAFTAKRFEPDVAHATMHAEFLAFTREPGGRAFAVDVTRACWRLHPWRVVRETLERHGFGRIEAYGGYGGEPFDPATSADLVCHAVKHRDVHVLCDGKGART